MPSRRSPLGWLLRKEWRQLAASRAWWLMLALTGPVVGFSFITAVRTYAEVSAGAGSGCGAVCDPLVGVWAPTFGAFEIVAVFVLPFVAIRLVSANRLSGAAAIELQRPLSSLVRVGAKMAVLLAGWLASYAAAMLAIVLWLSYGGHVALPELAVALGGQLLNAALAIAIAAAAASMTSHPSTAAIVTLAVTVGGWIVEFIAAINGGWWERLAAATPSAMVATFNHGLVQASTVLAAGMIVAAGLAVAAVWTRPGRPGSRRGVEAAAVAAAAAVLLLPASGVRGSWDASQSRQNSFSEPETEALERLTAPLFIEAHLAPQDPRRIALERSAFAKLRRAVPDVTITYVARTTSGLYEQADPGYGEIWYAMGEKRLMGRPVTDEGVLETIFLLAGVTPAAESDDFRGEPLVASPEWAPVLFYGFWPAAVAAAAFLGTRRHS